MRCCTIYLRTNNCCPQTHHLSSLKNCQLTTSKTFSMQNLKPVVTVLFKVVIAWSNRIGHQTNFNVFIYFRFKSYEIRDMLFVWIGFNNCVFFSKCNFCQTICCWIFLKWLFLLARKDIINFQNSHILKLLPNIQIFILLRLRPPHGFRVSIKLEKFKV